MTFTLGYRVKIGQGDHASYLRRFTKRRPPGSIQVSGIKKMGVFGTIVIVWTIIGILTNWGYGHGNNNNDYNNNDDDQDYHDDYNDYDDR
jgi:hypothetical protein